MGQPASPRAIKGSRVVGFADLGMEAIRELEVSDFPVTVAVDSDGINVHPLPRSRGASGSRRRSCSRMLEAERNLEDEVRSLLAEAKRLGVRYQELTGKPLGVTGEVAELEAAEKLGLQLCTARTPGYDALDLRAEPARRVQIKGRAVNLTGRYRGRCPAIKCGDLFDDAVLVLLDRRTLNAIEIWSADEESIEGRLSAPGSKARNERKTLSISQFKSIARRVWPADDITQI